MSSVSSDPGVDLGSVRLREVAAIAPVERAVRAGVDRVRRVDAEGVEAIAIVIDSHAWS